MTIKTGSPSSLCRPVPVGTCGLICGEGLDEQGVCQGNDYVPSNGLLKAGYSGYTQTYNCNSDTELYDLAHGGNIRT